MFGYRKVPRKENKNAKENNFFTFDLTLKLQKKYI